MKIDYINALMALAVSALLAGGCYSLSQESLKATSAVVTFITLAITGITAMAVKAGEERSSIVIRSTAGFTFCCFLVENYAFSFCNYSQTFYIILNCIAALIFLTVCRVITKSGM